MLNTAGLNTIHIIHVTFVPFLTRNCTFKPKRSSDRDYIHTSISLNEELLFYYKLDDRPLSASRVLK